MCILVTWVYTLKFNRGEGWGDSCLSVRFGSASAVQMVEFLSFIPRHESRYEFPVSFLVSIKKMNKVFFLMVQNQLCSIRLLLIRHLR